MLYRLARPFLFALDPEAAHALTLKSLGVAARLGLAPAPPPAAPCHVMGLEFPNPVGLAAGLDKDGEHLDALGALGFGFIEVGTVTPRPQPGNPPPRLFRIPAAQALVNRMGFNNAGVDRLVDNIRRSGYRGILGVNIGKNADTPVERAADDYLACLRKVYAHAGYVAVNVSSPNTPGLRTLQNAAELEHLLAALAAERRELAQAHGRYLPLAVKIAPDLAPEQVAEIAALLLKHRMDAVIATNTTLAREGVLHLPHGGEAGGLSGAPLKDRATAVVRQLAARLAGALPIIGVGGILCGADAKEKIAAGASLVQLYTGLVYRGPALLPESVAALADAAPAAVATPS